MLSVVCCGFVVFFLRCVLFVVADCLLCCDLMFADCCVMIVGWRLLCDCLMIGVCGLTCVCWPVCIRCCYLCGVWYLMLLVVCCLLFDIPCVC